MRHYAYARVTDAEYHVLRAVAQKEGLSISNFVRRCVNSYLLELGDDVALLEERQSGRLSLQPLSIQKARRA